MLHVLNLRNGREWKARPSSAAHRRDYYRVSGANPDAFEDELGRMEAAAMAVIHETHDSLEVPSGASLEALLTFVAGMGARTPPHRDHFNHEEAKFLEVAQDMYAAHPEALEDLKQRTLSGEPHSHSLEFLQHVSGGKVELSSSWAVERLRTVAEITLRFLVRMTWSLVIPRPGCGPFICSDLAAVLHNPPIGSQWSPPGFGCPDAEFTFPLSCRMVLFGRYGGSSLKGVADERGMAVMNARTLRYADEAYSPTEDFMWLTPSGAIGRKADLQDLIAGDLQRSGDENGDEE
jgi:hypothetical protein